MAHAHKTKIRHPSALVCRCGLADIRRFVCHNFNGFVQGVSEEIGGILKQQKVKVAYKPQQTISSLFPHPKELDDSDRQKSGIVYKINCTQCNFVYDQNSKVASHVHQFSHNMNFANVKVVGVESNYHEQLFLEAWHSTVDPNAGNDHIVLPEVYKDITRA